MPTWSSLRNSIRSSSRVTCAYGDPGVRLFTPRRGGTVVRVPGRYSFEEVVMGGSVIVDGARTPMGRLLGSLRDFSGADLGGVAIRAALARAGVAGDQVQYVIMGQVLQAGAGQIPSRQAAVQAGIPMSVPSLTINKVCLSGLDAIALADQLIAAGEFDIVVA